MTAGKYKRRRTTFLSILITATLITAGIHGTGCCVTVDKAPDKINVNDDTVTAALTTAVIITTIIIADYICGIEIPDNMKER